MSSQDHSTQTAGPSSGWVIPNLDELSHMVSRALGKADIVYRADGLTFIMIEADDATVEALALFGAWREDAEDDDPAEDGDPREDDDPDQEDDPDERPDNGWPNPDPWGDTLVQGRRI